LLFAQREHHHVSAERLISGALGFPLIRDFFYSSGRLHDFRFGDLNVFLKSPDPGQIISDGAKLNDPACLSMLNLFIAMYAAEAGNLALKVNALGGIYICGGIAHKNLDALKSDIFLQAFSNKGRYRSLLKQIPVRVITDPHNALAGLAFYAKSTSI
jgi:glucokinase